MRQSTQAQVQLNFKSQRWQYELVDTARRWGFRKVEVIDEDLGRTASGALERPGFERLVDDLCTGQVGAVLCLDHRQHHHRQHNPTCKSRHVFESTGVCQ